MTELHEEQLQGLVFYRSMANRADNLAGEIGGVAGEEQENQRDRDRWQRLARLPD